MHETDTATHAPPPADRILIVRPSAMGDIVMASPVIDVLRTAYPHAHIAWLVAPPLEELLAQHPGLDECIPFPKIRWSELSRPGRAARRMVELRRGLSAVRRGRFDLVLDLQGLLKSRVIARWTGAKRRIGFVSREPGARLMTHLIDRGPHSEQMGSEYRYLMDRLGLSAGEFRSRVFVAPGAEATVQAQLTRRGVTGAYAVLCPFTTRPQKHWLASRWAELARALRERQGLHPLMLGSPDDGPAARHIQTLAQGGILDLTGRTTLGQCAAIIRGSALVIGVDTGLTHMGTALRRPTVALFGATRPYLSTESPQTRVLYRAHPCSPCKRRPTCGNDFPCMRAIHVAEVLQTAAELLGRGKP